jgi:tyrosyl-DNA phosphodiesterase-1
MIIATLQDVSKDKQTQRPVARDSGSDTETDDDDVVEVVEPVIGWAYVGSHNFTPSAWGTLSGSNVNPVLNVNYSLPTVILKA